MNLIDFITGSAEVLTRDRPDLYPSQSEAVSELYTQIQNLREIVDSEFATVSFSSYVLLRIYQDDCEEFLLCRKLTGALNVPGEGMSVYAFDRKIDLPYILDLVVDDDE